MARFVVFFAVIWVPIFLVLLNHRRWKRSTWAIAGEALGLAALTTVFSAACFAVIAVIFN
jgi:hypothetical protein